MHLSEFMSCFSWLQHTQTHSAHCLNHHQLLTRLSRPQHKLQLFKILYIRPIRCHTGSSMSSQPRRTRTDIHVFLLLFVAKWLKCHIALTNQESGKNESNPLFFWSQWGSSWGMRHLLPFSSLPGAAHVQSDCALTRMQRWVSSPLWGEVQTSVADVLQTEIRWSRIRYCWQTQNL